DGAMAIDDRIRGLVAFAWANVLDDAFRAGRGPYDVIFCRNLLIYLDADARARMERTFDALLAADGVLVLGAAVPPIMRGGWMPAGRRDDGKGRAAPAPARAGVARPPEPLTPPKPLDDVLHEAGTLANAGRLVEALAVCERAHGERAPSPELFFLMGMIHQSAGDLDRAEGCLHKTLYLDATHDEALLALALIAAQRGDDRMAETYRQSAARALARKEAP
ncbi:MAG: CheR family methyltransferase, partial [Planctomycetaceae bacterium]